MVLSVTGMSFCSLWAGTTTPIQRVHTRPIVDGAARVWSGQHVEPATRVVESNAGVSRYTAAALARAVAVPRARFA